MDVVRHPVQQFKMYLHYVVQTGLIISKYYSFIVFAVGIIDRIELTELQKDLPLYESLPDPESHCFQFGDVFTILLWRP